MYNIDGKYATSHLMAVKIFLLYLTVYEIFAIQENAKLCGLENEGQGEERGLSYSTGNVKIYIYIMIFENFSYHTKSAMQICVKTGPT